MSEERAIYHIQPAEGDQSQQKTQPVSLTLSKEQVREVIQYAAQASPELIVAEALKLLANHPDMVVQDLLSEDEVQRILRILTKSNRY